MTPTPYFFIGIGGIGMSAIARYYLHFGHPVAGYDRVETPLTQELVRLGATIFYDDDSTLIPSSFTTSDTVVIYTPAIPHDNSVRCYYEKSGCAMLKRSEALGHITRHSQALCVAGTHGKTTTSTLLAHLLQQSSIGASAFLGGLSLNYGSNLLLSESPYVVVEADEYDRSFHRLSPHAAIITSVQPDHLDIYGDEATFCDAFAHFTSLISPQGVLLLHEDAELSHRVPQGTQVYTYGQGEGAAYRYAHLQYEGGELYFDFHHPQGVWHRMHIGTPIEINVVNATAALALAYHCGCTEAELREGLASFKGAHRRFERVLNGPGPILIDDYAHHPDEIRASLLSIRRLYPERRVTVVFQPHLYSRTADFQQEFGAALSLCDDVILLDIYPARELPIPGITSHSIAQYLTSPRHTVVSKSGLLAELEQHDLDVVVMMGAGDIEFEVPHVATYLHTLSSES